MELAGFDALGEMTVSETQPTAVLRDSNAVSSTMSEFERRSLGATTLQGVGAKLMTTFPRACPSSRYRMASGTSFNG